MFEEILKQGKQLVVQSNPLVNAQYKLDLVEQKVLRYLISMITPYETTFEKKFYRVHIKDLEQFLGWQKPGEIFQYIKRVADRLRMTTVKIFKPDVTIVTSWIASYKYPHDKGWIEFEFSTNLETELLQLKKQFTQYYLKNISKLKSQYSIRIYELLKQYLSVGERSESIADLRTMLGIEANEYKLYGDLKKRVLDPAHKEINQKTDINYDWKPIKEARKVIGIMFYGIQHKAYISDRILSLIPRRHQDNKQVLNTVRKYIELCGEDYIVEKLYYTNSRNPKRWTDYLWKACEYNYGEGYTPDQDTGTYVLVDTPKARAAAESRKKEKELEELKREYEEYRKKTIEEYLDTLNASGLEKLKEDFEKSLDHHFVKNKYKESGLESPLIRAEYMEYIYEKHIPADARVSFLDFAKAKRANSVQ